MKAIAVDVMYPSCNWMLTNKHTLGLKYIYRLMFMVNM